MFLWFKKVVKKWSKDFYPVLIYQESNHMQKIGYVVLGARNKPVEPLGRIPVALGWRRFGSNKDLTLLKR